MRSPLRDFTVFFLFYFNPWPGIYDASQQRFSLRQFRYAGSVYQLAVLSLQLGSGIYFTMGDSLTLLSAVFFSFYTCTVAKVSGGLDASLFTFVQLLATAIWSTITLPISGADFSVIGQNWLSFGAVVFLGLFNTGLCYLIQMVAQKSLPPTRVSLILSSESLFGAVFSVLAGYDPFSIRLVVGGGIMVFSILLVETNLFGSHSKKQIAAHVE